MMAIMLFGKRYSNHAWRKALKCNEGIFKKIVPMARFLGPHLTDSNQFVGDALIIEITQFEENATEFQKRVFQKLEKLYPEKAYEYLLTIVDAIDKWKQDIDVLQRFLRLLKQKEKELEEEEDELEDIKKINLHLPDIVKRHFPDVFARLDLDWKNLDSLHQDMVAAIGKIEGLEERIELYFKNLKKRNLKFLFD